MPAYSQAIMHRNRCKQKISDATVRFSTTKYARAETHSDQVHVELFLTKQTTSDRIDIPREVGWRKSNSTEIEPITIRCCFRETICFGSILLAMLSSA
jgi:hypothetical protein